MTLTMEAVLQRARPVLPVLVLEDIGLAVDLAGALQAGGVEVLEVTLRTERALDALAAIRQAFPQLLVGAGTLIHSAQFAEARDAGAQFAVSPGLTERLAAAAEGAGLPYLPGVMTLDGGIASTDGGYSAGDMAFLLEWKSDLAIDAAIVRMIRLYSRVHLLTRAGAFEVILEKYRLGTSGKSTVNCLVTAQLSA